MGFFVYTWSLNHIFLLLSLPLFPETVVSESPAIYDTFNTDLSLLPIFDRLPPPFRPAPSSPPYHLSIIVTLPPTSPQLPLSLAQRLRQPIYTLAGRIYLLDG